MRLTRNYRRLRVRPGHISVRPTTPPKAMRKRLPHHPFLLACCHARPRTSSVRDCRAAHAACACSQIMSHAHLHSKLKALNMCLSLFAITFTPACVSTSTPVSCRLGWRTVSLLPWPQKTFKSRHCGAAASFATCSLKKHRPLKTSVSC